MADPLADEPGPALPIEGLRVVDLSRVLSGPYCTMVLADLGADVIKVEPFPGGDDACRFGPHSGGESYCFAMVNRNKRSVALDLKAAGGQAAALRLIETADVLVENFRPGVMERLGLGYEALSERVPGLIYCSISGFGHTGPYRSLAGYDLIAQGMTGLMRMTGEPGGAPVKVGIAINDLAAGATAVQAVLAAYIHRLSSGAGQHIDLSLVDSGLAWTVWEAAAYFGAGELPEPTGTRHRRSAPYQAYRTRDGHVTVGANNERLWRQFCSEVVDRLPWLEDARYRDADARLKHADELEADIEEVFTEHSTSYWLERLEAAGVPGGPVFTYDEAVADPQVLARGMVQVSEHPRIGPMQVLGSPLHLSATPPRLRTPAPLLGEHSTQVLTAIGYDAQEIEAMYDAGVLYDDDQTGGAR